MTVTTEQKGGAEAETAEWLSDLDALRCRLASHPELVTPHLSASVTLDPPRDHVARWVDAITEALDVKPTPTVGAGAHVSFLWRAGRHHVFATVRKDAVGHPIHDPEGWVWDIEVAS
jgi:hypothetical protein